MALQATLQTMTTFALLLAVGFIAGKAGVVKKDFMGALGNLITMVFLPALIFYSTTTTVTRELIASNLALFPIAAIVFAALILVTFVLAKAMRIPHDKDRIFQFSFVFGNSGFVGIPLLNAVFPETGMLFMCLFVVIEQALFWTYGIWLSTARDSKAKGFSPKSLLSPNIIAIVLAMVWVFSGLELPGPIDAPLSALSKATSPLCMLFLGAMICFNKIGGVVRRPELYVGIVAKMVALPVLAGFLAGLAALPADIAGCVVLYVALPVMTVVPMVSAQNGREGAYATGIAVVTFVACLATIPLVALLAL